MSLFGKFYQTELAGKEIGRIIHEFNADRAGLNFDLFLADTGYKIYPYSFPPRPAMTRQEIYESAAAAKIRFQVQVKDGSILQIKDREAADFFLNTCKVHVQAFEGVNSYCGFVWIDEAANEKSFIQK